jgi:hypothetical protein
MPRQRIHFIIMYLLVAALAAVALLIDTWPGYPRSWLQWGLLLVIALPVAVLGDWLTDGALSGSVSLALARRTRSTQLTWGRMSYCVALYILFAICAVAAFYWLQYPAI